MFIRLLSWVRIVYLFPSYEKSVGLEFGNNFFNPGFNRIRAIGIVQNMEGVQPEIITLAGPHFHTIYFKKRFIQLL